MKAAWTFLGLGGLLLIGGAAARFVTGGPGHWEAVDDAPLPAVETPFTPTAWCDPAGLTHDFGVRLPTDEGFVHTYRLVNTTAEPVHIVRVDNEKPCCGVVTTDAPLTLPPGEGFDVTVRLHSANTGGRVSHVARVVTDEAPEADVELRTLMTLVPRSTIEPVAPGRNVLLAGESETLEFVVTVSGPIDEAEPMDAGRWTAVGLPDLAWSDEPPVTERDDARGLRVTRRVLRATLRADGEPGFRASELVVHDGSTELARHRLQWEVAPAIRAEPAGLYISAEAIGRAQRVRLTAVDRQPFRILSVAGVGHGIEVEPAVDDTPQVARTLTLTLGPRAGDERDDLAEEIVVATDHPRQPDVKITVLRAGGSSAAGAGEDSP